MCVIEQVFFSTQSGYFIFHTVGIYVHTSCTVYASDNTDYHMAQLHVHIHSYYDSDLINRLDH